MGYAKYTEDIQEDRDINLAKFAPAFFSTRPTPVPVYTCPYCKEEFTTNEALFSHMRLKHNAISTVLQLNGKIIPPGEHIEVAIESLRLFPVKDLDSFLFNGKSRQVVIDNGYIDAKPFQKDEFKTLTIEVDSQKWIIYRSKLSTVSKRVNDIIADLNAAVLDRKRPDLEVVKQQIKAHHLDIRDEQYIYGFYEYCLACLIDEAEKNDLYFGAYNKLLPYMETNSRARLIIKIICLRYLWIDRLDELCRASKPNEFSLVCGFLQGNQVPKLAKAGAFSDNIFEIFVEDDEYENTQEIIHFMKGDFNAVKRYLGKAIKIAENDKIGKNLRDKIFLLQARLSEYEGNAEKSRHYYKRVSCPSIVQYKEA